MQNNIFNSSPFFFNIVQLNKLIKNKIKKGKKNISFNTVLSFIFLLNNYNYLKEIYSTVYYMNKQKLNLKPKFHILKINYYLILQLSLKVLLKTIQQYNHNIILCISQYFTYYLETKKLFFISEIKYYFKRITPTLILKKNKKNKFINRVLPLIIRTTLKKDKIALGFFLKTIPNIKTQFKKNYVLNLFNEYTKLKKFTSDSILKKLEMYSILSQEISTYSYKYYIPGNKSKKKMHLRKKSF